jgi:hypothetical protein
MRGLAERFAKWILDAMYPVLPSVEPYSASLEDAESFVGAGDGEKPSSGGGLSEPADATPTQVGPAGEKPASSAKCTHCGGTGSIGVGSGAAGCYSYHMIPCTECSQILKFNMEDESELLDKLFGKKLSPDDTWAEGWKQDELIDKDLEQKAVGDYYDNALYEDPDYSKVESFETPKAQDFMTRCPHCEGLGETGEGFVCGDCKGEGKVLADKRYGWHICDGKERPYSALFCSFCRGNRKDSDLIMELERAHKLIEQLKAELKHARDAGQRENLTANNEIKKKLEVMSENKMLRSCLDKIQDHLSRVYEGYYYDKSRD